MSTTLEIYTLPIPEQQRAAIERLSVLMANDGRSGQNSKGLPLGTELVTHSQHTTAGKDIYESADPVRMHLTSDLTLSLVLNRDVETGTAACLFGISGYIDAL